jgi:hypothetical protein
MPGVKRVLFERRDQRLRHCFAIPLEKLRQLAHVVA